MTKLKLGPLADDKPVKVALEPPADVHRDLVAYPNATVEVLIDSADLDSTAESHSQKAETDTF